MMILPDEILGLMIDHLSGEGDEGGDARLREWLDNTPGGEEEWATVCALWTSGAAGGGRLSPDVKAWERLRARRTRRVRARWTRRAAVAATVAGAMMTGWWLTGDGGKEDTNDLATWLEGRERGRARLELSDGRVARLDGVSETREGGVVVAGDSSGASYRLSGEAADGAMHRLVVPRGGEYRLTLSEGTVVALNAGSSLRFPAVFGEGERVVWLEGEGYFKVSASASRPFSVHAGGTVTRALGTVFDVYAHAGEGVTGVTLLEGVAEVTTAGGVTRLTPGFRLSVEGATGDARLERVDAAAVVAWVDGVFRFEDISLEDLARRLERWYDVPFSFREEGLKRRRFSGGFHRHESLERVSRLIGEVVEARFRVSRDTIVVEAR